ncbi:uncharacterized protein K452DRAFT_143193 [Aplosporella prunicola CBS 121167]|uniref:SEC7 domain-containing protein n=1 Tax=Aplosporella prunicola CBS 121167 TaxID=1176127 RepID=A0A6A6BKF0_9PEZI|nr:uncharacterized protein K452DRAFT_143193 [Aplosporella prunicola CBS 121167]KAF2144516.1 hypothetical protein K452DRAFT_143193 [Aplosporella prunicola CBS 121167]
MEARDQALQQHPTPPDMALGGAMRDDDSPPKTPPRSSLRLQKGKAPMRALDTHNLRQESFYDEADTPSIDQNRFSAGSNFDASSRDSHDLNLRDVTRDSVVDNMLLSLDSLPNGSATFPTHFGGLYSSFDDDDDFYKSEGRFSPPQVLRSPNHTYATAYGSEYDGRPDSRYSHHASRGRRSNSTANFRSDLDRIDSNRIAGYGSARMGADTQKKALFGEGGYSWHARGERNGSKGSTSSSVDYGFSTQIISSGRRTNRSSSFDNGYEDRHLRDDSPGKQDYGSILDRGRPNVFTYASYDAAPTPTIPTGTHRFDDPPQSAGSYAEYVSPQPAFASMPPGSGPSSRRNSLRSAPSKGMRRGKPQGPDASILAQANEFVNAANSRELPPLPAFANSPISKTTSPQSQQPPKERPGFFRRVFGGGKSQQPAQEASRGAPQLPPVETRLQHDSAPPNVPPKDSARSGSISQAQKQQKQMKEQPTPTLNKKNSSFFRRRKKSITEPAPPLPIQTNIPPADAVGSGLPSPEASSLRQVMTPFLNESVVPGNTYYDGQEKQPVDNDDEVPRIGGFSPDYKPHKDATVRAVKPGSGGTDEGVPLALEGVQNLHARGQDSPKYKLKVKRGKGGASKPSDDASFLADSSGNEDTSGDVASSRKGPSMGKPDHMKRPSTSPAPPTFIQHNSKDSANPRAKANTGEKRSGKPSAFADMDADDGGWVVTDPNVDLSANDALARDRLRLEPTSSDDELDEQADLALPLDGPRSSSKNLATPIDPSTPNTPSDVYHSAASLPIVQIEGGDLKEEDEDAERMDGPLAGRITEPSDEEREKARKIYDGEEDFISKGRAAAWLGEKTPVSERCRKAYMELYEWTGFSVLLAMRDLCGRLILKGETQEVDRILDAFANRWCECNPNHGFKTTGVVHTMCYSLLLLNTDLHMADIESKMTRGQFVKNTLPTITAVVEDELSELDEDGNPKRSATPHDEPFASAPVSPTFENKSNGVRESVDFGTAKRSKNRLSIRPAIGGLRLDSEGLLGSSDSGTGDSCTILVKAPFEGSMKGWEYQVEIVLKEFYNSIKHDKLPLHGGASQDPPSSSNNNLSVEKVLRRSPSVLSKAPSDTTSYRGRSHEFRSASSRWNSKTRSRPKIYQSSTIGSSRTSLDDQSVFSPPGSSKWSTYSFGKTQTSMSVDSLGSHFVPVDYQQSIGFANALSQAIIREENQTIGSHDEYDRVVPLLEDETLGLAGPPWAKEGMLKHKHHLEALDKKAKDRNWSEVFAVIEKGYMKLFTFSSNAKSLRSKAKNRRPSTGGVVGGGNWTDNAEQLDSFLLRQTLASSLPPPGYSKSRPHVWALSLPTGAVHLFQCGTPEIVKEFVLTANYWSARLSKEPLVGGVSNLEYGWSENVINTALIRPESSPPANSSTVGMPRPSIQSSIRSSMDHGTGTVKARLPGDKVTLSDWTPPTQSMMASNLMEVDQLKALTAYVKNIEEELSRHQELRAPIQIAFSPRHPNAAKAIANFEKKSAYLLREIVKFRTYIDALTLAQDNKDKIYKDREQREAENAAAKAEGAAAEAAEAAEKEGKGEEEKEEKSRPGTGSDDDSALRSSLNRLITEFDAD